jgi:hypothetical protein
LHVAALIEYLFLRRPEREPAVAAPRDALSNLAGGGYADPNYVPPTEAGKTWQRARIKIAAAVAAALAEADASVTIVYLLYACAAATIAAKLTASSSTVHLSENNFQGCFTLEKHL